MTKFTFQKLSIFLFMLILVVSFQNCSTGFEGTGEGDPSSSSSSTGNDPGTMPPVTPPVTPPVQPPPVPPPVTPPPTTTTKKALVTVGVGVGGRIISGLNGFETLIYDHEVFSPTEQNSIKADPNDPNKLICPAGWMQIGSVCCLAQYECIGGGWHSDFLFRGIAFGNGHFVAVGGQIHGIVQVSADGINWAPKINLVAQSGKVAGASTSLSWLSGVAYGKGRFVAVEGYSGKLAWSVDGINWIATGKAPAVRNTLRRIYFIGNRFYASGDNSSWGFSDDGSTWSSTGYGTPAPTEVYVVGNKTYGFVGDKIYELSSPTATSWTLVYTHSSAIGSFIYNDKAQTFHILTGNSTYVATSPSGPWTKTSVSAPGRWAHFSGEYFVGNGTFYSADAKVWRQTPSATAASVIQQYASGLVDIP